MLFSGMLNPKYFEMFLPVASVACDLRRDDEHVKAIDKVMQKK